MSNSVIIRKGYASRQLVVRMDAGGLDLLIQCEDISSADNSFFLSLLTLDGEATTVDEIPVDVKPGNTVTFQLDDLDIPFSGYYRVILREVLPSGRSVSHPYASDLHLYVLPNQRVRTVSQVQKWLSEMRKLAEGGTGGGGVTVVDEDSVSITLAFSSGLVLEEDDLTLTLNI